MESENYVEIIKREVKTRNNLMENKSKKKSNWDWKLEIIKWKVKTRNANSLVAEEGVRLADAVLELKETVFAVAESEILSGF